MTVTRSIRPTLEGTVVSDKMTQTIAVRVERTYKHAKYKKYVRKAAKYYAHDENSEAKPGDKVEIAACRPMSKLKRWRLVRIVEKSRQVGVHELSGVEGVDSLRAVTDAASDGGAS
jgi:small subunit ribosomal protein S17